VSNRYDFVRQWEARLYGIQQVAWLIIIASPLMVLSVLLIGLAGFHMALTTWGLQTPWIAVALVSFVLMAPIGPFVLDLRMRTIIAMAGETPDGPLPDALDKRIHDPILGTAAQTLATVLLSIVFLMTNKPTLTTAIMVMVIALACGLLSGVPYWYTARRWAKSRAVSSDRTSEDPFLKKTIWTRRWKNGLARRDRFGSRKGAPK
jgi:hypothetical protein